MLFFPGRPHPSFWGLGEEQAEETSINKMGSGYRKALSTTTLAFGWSR